MTRPSPAGDDALRRLSGAVADGTPLPDLLAAVADEALARIGHPDGSAAMVVDCREGGTSAVLARDPASSGRQADAGAACVVLLERLRAGAAWAGTPGGASPGLVAVPLVLGGELWGALVVEGAGAEHAEDLEQFAQVASVVVAAGTAREDLEREALTDPLTGLANARHLWRRLGAEVDAARRRGRPLALAVLDLDRFKEVNDRFGHAVGDRVLSEAAARLNAAARAGDLVARAGGEEFAWVMPDTPASAAAAAVERARAAIAVTDFPGVGRVTISAGVSDLAGTDDARTLFQRADGGLYAAKHAGRDRIVQVPSVQGGSPVAAPATVVAGEPLPADRPEGIPALLYQDDDGRPQVRPIEGHETRLTIGRMPSCHLPLPWDAEVSRLHAVVERDGAGLRVTDAGSRNGTLVNGEPLTGPRRLAHGDEVRVGSSIITVLTPTG